MSEPTLTDFLLARFAEDEAGYRAEAAGIEWLTVNGRDLWPKLLAECEAKRRIVARVQMSQMLPPQISDHAAEAILHALALPYVDHPDYREDWRP